MLNHLLVIDDEIQFGQFVGRVGEDAGYNITVTSQPQDFKESFLRGSPSVIVLDLSMPSIDGLELLRWLASKNCRSHIIIMSGFDSRVIDAARQVGEERGLNICCTLSKPFRIKDMREKLEFLKQVGLSVEGSVPTARDPQKQLLPEILQLPVFNRSELSQGLKADEFFLLYQPKVFLKTGALEGVEALVRWRHPHYGVLSPYAFIDLIEETGLMDELTDRVLALVVRQQSKWRAEGVNLQVAVNLSPTNLRNEHFAANVVALCIAEKVPPQSLVFEVTETTAMTYKLEELDVLTRLRLQGFDLSIDDFGTGYSSLTRLQRLPATELKIDVSFVKNMLKNADTLIIVQTVVDMARNMKLNSIAEGVETPELYWRLVSFGCDIGQGYAIARPLSPDDFRQWKEAWKLPPQNFDREKSD